MKAVKKETLYSVSFLWLASLIYGTVSSNMGKSVFFVEKMAFFELLQYFYKKHT